MNGIERVKGRGRGVVCNPVDLPYRFQDFARGPWRAVFREAADPSIVRFRDRYYLFASMSGGYWHSDDLVSWQFHAEPLLPAGDYAPDVREVDGALYVTASSKKASPILRSTAPLTDGFERVANGAFPYWDPNVFQDDDGRVYLYWGCSNSEPVRGVQVDPATLQPIGEPVELLGGDPGSHGWERPGESNRTTAPATLREKLSARLFGTHSQTPYIEGAWMTKRDGRYYLQYAGPGTEYNVYADGYYTGPTPLGPFESSPDSPFSSKPGGFITGAGHGSTFQDGHGNWWHAATMRISVNHHFERRIGIFPAGFDDDGALFCNQNFGDYPTVVPDRRIDPWNDAHAGWMLQSYRASAEATSSAPGHGPALAVDEDIRTWWAAAGNEPGESLTIDLVSARLVHAVQVNVAEHKVARAKPRRLRHDPDYSAAAFRSIDASDHPVTYLLEASFDGTSWSVLHDGRAESADAPHRLVVLPEAAKYRHFRITGQQTPWNSVFAVSGLRVFGLDQRPAPLAVEPVVRRTEPRSALVRWEPIAGADGYNVRYGRHPERLYHSWQVWGENELDLSTLNAGEHYWVAVDAYNAGGVTAGIPLAVPPLSSTDAHSLTAEETAP